MAPRIITFLRLLPINIINGIGTYNICMCIVYINSIIILN